MKILESITFLNQTMEQPKIFNLLNGTVGIFTRQRPTKERDNQDSCGIIPINKDKALLVIADGVGGARAGDQASKLAIETLALTVNEWDLKMGRYRDMILEGFERSNKAIRDLSVGAGSTLVAAEIDSDFVRFFNTGDSIGQLYGGKGILKYKTLEQSASGYAIESQMIEEKKANDHEDSNMLLACLGDPVLRMEVSSRITTSARDIILLGSDGLWANASQEDISLAITSGSIEERMNRLIELASKGMDKEDGNPDDLTIILYSFGRVDDIQAPLDETIKTDGNQKDQN